LVTVPIWLRYEEKGAPDDDGITSPSIRQPPSSNDHQRVMVPGNTTRHSKNPSLDWGGSTLNGDKAARSGRPSSVDWETATPQGEATTKEATTSDISSSANLEGSTLDDQRVLKRTTIAHKLSAVDWTGSTLMIASSTSFLVGLSWGGNKYPWRSSAVLVPTIVGLAGIAFTVMYEKRYAKNPFLRLAIYQHWSGIVVSICTIIQGYLVSPSYIKHYTLHV
jgi:hypothetical protein